ncbi:MAG: HAD family hydrolase [Thermoplasmata archaeon]
MPSVPPPALVLFDLDDTLFDHSLTCRAALAEVVRTEPRFTSRSLDDLWHRYEERLNASDLTLGSVGHPPRVYEEARAGRFRALASSVGWNLDTGEARAISSLYRKQYLRLRRPVPGAVELVRRMARTVPIGIVTNNQVAEQVEKLNFLGISELVDHLIISEAVGVAKPDPAIFRAALEAAHVGPRDAVMVGNSWTDDVLGAHAAGIRPVWFNRFGRARPTRHRVEEITSFRPTPPAERTIRGGPPGRRARRR